MVPYLPYPCDLISYLPNTGTSRATLFMLHSFAVRCGKSSTFPTASRDNNALNADGASSRGKLWDTGTFTCSDSDVALT